MSEPIDSSAPEPAGDSFLDDYLEPAPAIDKPRPVRQGLPSSYRMRHDAHYVDELESRRRAAAPEPALVFPTSIPVTFALRDMSQELDGVASCFNLVPARSRPLRERLGLTLARVGVQRSMRSFQALRVLLEEPVPELEAVAMNAAIERALQGFDEELRLTETTLRVRLQELPAGVRADGRLLSVALQSCAGALIALIEASGGGGTLEVTSAVSGGSAVCELHQDAYRMGADQFARLTDLEWTDRPGGIPAGIGLAAAARIAQSHGGQLDARRSDSGGCTLSLVLPMARA